MDSRAYLDVFTLSCSLGEVIEYDIDRYLMGSSRELTRA